MINCFVHVCAEYDLIVLHFIKRHILGYNDIKFNKSYWSLLISDKAREDFEELIRYAFEKKTWILKKFCF